MITVSSFNLASLIYAHHCAPQFPLVLNLESEHGAWPPDFFRSRRLSAADRRVLRSGQAAWLSGLQAARRSKRAPF